MFANSLFFFYLFLYKTASMTFILKAINNTQNSKSLYKLVLAVKYCYSRKNPMLFERRLSILDRIATIYTVNYLKYVWPDSLSEIDWSCQIKI